ncbi:hypothetical protein HX021_13185 [Sphingobacterium sp. N143]|uniref:hypothetical protein n=1 Tax=Sphingobacterium sp. N143 TaxID=2746727 RepID=UPI0025764FF2|nr:hypothetical protein [Sphingobacterium sp. N143]MDM1295235.1 hypothetical protein [Sphingobacterium sp. N143]
MAEYDSLYISIQIPQDRLQQFFQAPPQLWSLRPIGKPGGTAGPCTASRLWNKYPGTLSAVTGQYWTTSWASATAGAWSNMMQPMDAGLF